MGFLFNSVALFVQEKKNHIQYNAIFSLNSRRKSFMSRLDVFIVCALNF